MNGQKLNGQWRERVSIWARQSLMAGILVLPAGAPGTTGLMMQRPEPNQTQTFEMKHAQVCEELARAGLMLMLIAWDARNRPMHVFYDADQNRYVSVSGSSPTWVRVSTGIPSLRGYTLTAD